MKKKKAQVKNIKVIREKKPREPIILNPIEKILIGMVGISIIATILAFFLEKEIITYVLLANYLFLGVITLVKPSVFIDIMRKSRGEYDDQYEKKERYVRISLRVAGVTLIGIGIYFGYHLFFL